jgi:hypothetical protein
LTGDLLKTINHQSAKADSFFVKEAFKEILSQCWHTDSPFVKGACGALRLNKVDLISRFATASPIGEAFVRLRLDSSASPRMTGWGV